MVLVRKLTAALIAGMIVLLAVYGYLNARREQDFLEGEVRRHQLVMGHVLGLAVTEVLARSGEEAALRLMEHADREDPDVHIRWVWLDARTAAAPGTGPDRR